ncbi:hypothetical protein B4N89_13445 [Embleya scabrispora]|uniref:Uncharacterized protein n=2 Tax=Embleya scabrispora TaxID=159449 RepID=A0A1T3NYI4_9ACTN|nr:hypothetical protein B4N89_13445 [Embleya scabrispora]
MRITANRLNSPPPLFTVNQAAAQSIAAATWVAITWPTPAVDTYVGWNIGAPTRYTAQLTGWYTICGAIAWAVNGTGARGVFLYKNGAPVLGHGAFCAPTPAQVTVATTPTRDLYLNAGDYVDLRGSQASGGPLNTVVTSDVTSGLSMRWTHA